MRDHLGQDPDMDKNKQFGLITPTLQKQLEAIVPSCDPQFAIKYFPCMVTLTNGTVLDRVCFVMEAHFKTVWCVNPKHSIRIEDVESLKESPTRLPACSANTLYEQGETGMGYFLFVCHIRKSTVFH